MKQLKFFGCLLAIVTGFVTLRGESQIYMGDVEIYVNDTVWKCDKIYCPPETHICRVTKEKLEPNATQVQRVDTCYSKNNEVLKQAINYDSVGASEQISLNVESYRNGVISSLSSIGGSFYSGNNYNHIYINGQPFDQKQLDNTMANVDRINAEVEEDLRKMDEEIERSAENFEREMAQSFNDWR